MSENGFKTFFRMGLVLLAMVLLLTPANLCAEQEGIDSDDMPCNTYIWDITGNYDTPLFEDCEMTMTLVQDGKGKITGSGDGICEMYIDDDDEGFWVWIDYEFDVKGKVTQKKGIGVVKLNVKIAGMAEVDIEDLTDLKFRAKQRLAALINPDTLTFDGVVKSSGCIQKVGCGKEVFENYSADLPIGMDGSWFLATNNIDDDGKKIMGESTLILANGNQLAMTAKGRINARKGEAKVKFSGVKTDPGAKGSSIMATVDEDENVLKMKGKVLGQQIGCK
jgi:hypothetical protein